MRPVWRKGLRVSVSGDLFYFEFDPNEFAMSGEVAAMTTEGLGAYVHLLCVAWRETPPCSLPNDDLFLAGMSRAGVDGWSKVRLMVRRAFREQGDRLYSPYLERKWREAKAKRNAASEKATKAARMRWQCSSNAQALPEQCQLESKSEKTKTERDNAGVREAPHLPDDGSGSVEAAMDAWSLASRGRGISATHGEHVPLRNAMFAWGQERPFGDGIVWHEAVIRCIRAAQGEGTKFGDSPKYAVRVIGSKLAAWRDGTPPEPAPSLPRDGLVFVPDDGAAERGVAAGLKRAAERRARATQ